jgi:MATE family multidrug resistance protein
VAPSTILIAVVLPFHVLLCYVLTHLTPLGIIGTAISITITFWTFGLALLLWIWRSRASQCWGGLSRRALEGWAPFIRMWLPALFMFATEWWAFEVTSLFAGRLGEIPVAAQAGLSSLDGALTTIPYAISLCSTARIGNLVSRCPEY